VGGGWVVGAVVSRAEGVAVEEFGMSFSIGPAVVDGGVEDGWSGFSSSETEVCPACRTYKVRSGGESVSAIRALRPYRTFG
jgi:hypothetical protein